MVASLGSDGMDLYVDGASVGNRTDVTTAQGYMGYWRIGGDSVGSWPSAPTSAYLNGTIDDVAVYQRVLSAAEVQDHFARSQGGPANQPPTADFDFTADDLEVAFDGTASTDPDGTIEDYSWDFDDGQSSTAESPDHTYAAAGSYDVTLTVTDNDGESDADHQDGDGRGARWPTGRRRVRSFSDRWVGERRYRRSLDPVRRQRQPVLGDRWHRTDPDPHGRGWSPDRA